MRSTHAPFVDAGSQSRCRRLAHAGARCAEVVIGERSGMRFVTVRDDGKGLSETDGAGQGLKNIRKRTESIDGGLTVTSKPGFGTALEVVLRA